MTCSNGPPWMPGKTIESISFAYFSRVKIKPPRGPRKSCASWSSRKAACLHRAGMNSCRDHAGDVRDCPRADMRPTSRAISPMRFEINDARIGARANGDHLRLVFACHRGDLVVIDVFGLLVHAVVDDTQKTAGKFALLPCVRCPPWLKSIVSILSPGFRNANKPPCSRRNQSAAGTLACSAPKVFSRGQSRAARWSQYFRSRHTSVFLDSPPRIYSQHRALRFHHRRAGEIFRRDSARCFPADVAFVFNRRGDFGINIQQRRFAGANSRPSSTRGVRGVRLQILRR